MASENLSKSERKFLETNAPDAVASYVRERGHSLATRVSAYRKVAAAAKAERQAISEVHLLRIVEMGGDPALAARSAQAEAEQLRQENRALVDRVTELRAAPALAVHSED
jgi:hypothetical protein